MYFVKKSVRVRHVPLIHVYAKKQIQYTLLSRTKKKIQKNQFHLLLFWGHHQLCTFSFNTKKCWSICKRWRWEWLESTGLTTKIDPGSFTCIVSIERTFAHDNIPLVDYIWERSYINECYELFLRINHLEILPFSHFLSLIAKQNTLPFSKISLFCSFHIRMFWWKSLPSRIMHFWWNSIQFDPVAKTSWMNVSIFSIVSATRNASRKKEKEREDDFCEQVVWIE